MYVGSAQPFEAVFESAETGLVGTVEVAVIDNDGVTVIGPVTTNITENVIGGTPTGVYTWNAPAAPAALGQYTIAWSLDGTWDPITVFVEDLVVVTASAGPLPPIPPPSGGGPTSGPCSAWTTSDSAAACCDPTTFGSDTSVLDDYVIAASELLFEYSGRLYVGLCEKTVRPPCRPGCGCGQQVLSRGHVVNNGWDWWGVAKGPCEPSNVLLSGYPVREITEVKIDGDIVAATEYELQGFRYLIRKNDGTWPSCQDLSLDDTEDGTWSVTYTYGQEPPLSGQMAADELACELYKACNNGAGECVLPRGTTRVARQGVVIERLAFSAWGLQNGIWRTGLSRVDAFLNNVNRSNLIRRPTVWSPARHMQYARRAGT